MHEIVKVGVVVRDAGILAHRITFEQLQHRPRGARER
jgi:hypothetical protein